MFKPFLHFQILFELVMPNSNIQISLMSFASKTLDVLYAYQFFFLSLFVSATLVNQHHSVYFLQSYFLYYVNVAAAQHPKLQLILKFDDSWFTF